MRMHGPGCNRGQYFGAPPRICSTPPSSGLSVAVRQFGNRPARIRTFPAGLERMAHDPRGPVVRDLHRRAQNVVALASRRAAGPIIDIDSGRLQSSIHYEIQERPTGDFLIGIRMLRKAHVAGVLVVAGDAAVACCCM